MKEEVKLLSEIAKELGVNKSMLAYYKQLGLIQPKFVVGGKEMELYEEPKTTDTIKKILKWREECISLNDIKEKLCGSITNRKK